MTYVLFIGIALMFLSIPMITMFNQVVIGVLLMLIGFTMAAVTIPKLAETNIQKDKEDN
jgi:xanthine/uracil permease